MLASYLQVSKSGPKVFGLILVLSRACVQASNAQSEIILDELTEHRSTWDVIFSCIATVFACTWIAVHPNVPGPDLKSRGWVFIGLHRLKLMVIAIIAPEVIIIWAFRQWMVASIISKHFGLTKTHGFFISMGGFIGAGGTPIKIADLLQLDGLALFQKSFSVRPDLDMSSISNITEEELQDRSKGDALSKLVAVVQTTWFVVQYLSRFQESLPVTQLETATLAFAVLNIFNYVLWWHKPLDRDFYESTLAHAGIYHSTEHHMTTSRHAAPCCLACFTLSITLVSDVHRFPFFDYTYTDAHQWFSYATYGRFTTAAFQSILQWYRRTMGRILFGRGWSSAYGSVPTLWAGTLDYERTWYIGYFGAAVGALFGGTHCIAWSSVFASDTERILWRISSLVVTAVPVALAMQLAFIRILPNRKIVRGIQATTPLLILLYLLARMTLLVEAFFSLRFLQPGVLEEVSWTKFIPHL
ncbi:uncharacterized protein EV420DRAFT_1641498 [Desarmillaria tabescens]|uniref:Uncharacterized protein n=1 Tax=Armillaria tabescens TaxID=1929756 RepID=A0AA39KHI4_ARMTA|nr:uncharacterized protein EV420DRAFT_1641498 [Desarmillaria tabescens]KAK0460170.1 hypothetical protein EV420DRAFT_1641498 [Desarmillaria tabescens]